MALTKKAGSYGLKPADHMKLARERDAVPLFKQLSGYLAARAAGTQLTFHEYLFFGLYRTPRAAYGQFMGLNRIRAATFIANDMSRWNEDGEKLHFALSMTEARLPQAAPYAFAHATRQTGPIAALRTESELSSFLAEGPARMFGKPTNASHGDQTVMITGRQGDTLTLASGETITAAKLAREIAPFMAEGEGGYLFQEVLTPHPVIAAITDGRLCSLRVLVLRRETGPEVKEAVLRLPAGPNRVDNFRRKGNMVAAVDLAAGTLGSALRGIGAEATLSETHPDTGAPIAGVPIPDFAAVKALVAQASGLFPDQTLQSWDVAVTDRGPVLLEVNVGGQFNLIQLANGRGLYDADFRAFIEARLNSRDLSGCDPKTVAEAKKLLGLR